MKRAGSFLLVACAVLVVGSAAGGLARAASTAVYERLGAPAPAATPSPSSFVYLPLIVLDSGAWVTVVEEGFEAPPSNLWEFWDSDGPVHGTYYWARLTDCRQYSGNYGAWAVGGGADGALLDCSSPYPDNYPNNVDSWMAYGPFSLEDATAASLSLKLWLNVDPELTDSFCVYASSDGITYGGACLTYQPTDWAPVTFRLDDALASVDMRGKPEVWIALNFVSDGSVNFPEGAYVDDIVVRKCVGGICPASSSSVPAPAAVRAERTLGSRPVKSSPYSTGR